MSRRLTRAVHVAAAASLAIIATGPGWAVDANAASAVRPDQPQPGATLSVAGEGNARTDLFYTGTSGKVWMLHMSDTDQPVPVSLGGSLIGGPAAVWMPPGHGPTWPR